MSSQCHCHIDRCSNMVLVDSKESHNHKCLFYKQKQKRIYLPKYWSPRQQTSLPASRPANCLRGVLKLLQTSESFQNTQDVKSVLSLKIFRQFSHSVGGIYKLK